MDTSGTSGFRAGTLRELAGFAPGSTLAMTFLLPPRGLDGGAQLLVSWFGNYTN